MIKAIKTGIVTGIFFFKISLILYIFLLMGSLPFGVQIYHVFESSIGNSLETGKIMAGFDNTVFSDFLNAHGHSITPLIGQIRWVLLLFGIFVVFINSGVLYTVAKGKPTWKSFWEGCSTYFLRFLVVVIFFSILIMLWTALIWVPIISNFEKAAEIFPSEKTFIWVSLVAILVWIWGISILITSSISARLFCVHKKTGSWRSIRAGIKWAFTHIFKSTGFLLFFGLLQGLLIAGYLSLESSSGMISPGLIWVFAGLQQLLIFLGNIIRIMVFGGLNEMVGRHELH